MPTMDLGKWELKGGDLTFGRRLTRTYVISDFTLRIDFRIDTSEDMNHIKNSLSIYLQPFKLPQSKLFVMAFFTEELKGGFVQVQAIPNNEWGEESMLDAALRIHNDDVLKCQRALASGSPINFGLFDPIPPPAKPFLTAPLEPRIGFQFPNDLDFKRLYDEANESTARSQDATRARHLREGWYRRRFADAEEDAD